MIYTVSDVTFKGSQTVIHCKLLYLILSDESSAMTPILLVIFAPKKEKICIAEDLDLLHFEHLFQYYDMNHMQYRQFHNSIFCIYLYQFPLA